jgi:single-stranded DNA-binding protein
MIGLNVVCLSGNLGGTVTEGTTTDGTAALAFDVVCQSLTTDPAKPTRVWTRVNVYDPELLARIRPRLTRGVYVQIHGELMNRRGRTTELLEIRATKIITMEKPAV